MTRSDSRFRITPSNDIEDLIFDALKKGNDNASAKGGKAISAYYLPEVAFELDPKLEDPKLRVAITEAMCDLEARLKLIRSLFPDLAPVTQPAQPVLLPPTGLANGQGQAQSEVKPNDEASLGNSASFESTEIEDSQIRQAAETGPTLTPSGDVDVFSIPLSQFEVSEREMR